MNYRKSTTESGIPSHKSHFVYILLCADGTFYTGYTTELPRRIQMHNEGKGAKYTRGRGPVSLLYAEEGESRSWGIRREKEIQSLTRGEKAELIRTGGTARR